MINIDTISDYKQDAFLAMFVVRRSSTTLLFSNDLFFQFPDFSVFLLFVLTAYKDCKEALKLGVKTSQVAFLTDLRQNTVMVSCDMSTDGGGWTVFQRRNNGSVDFFRNWTEYENGFGDASSEFWLGNKWIHHLTSLGPTELRIDFNDARSQYATYRRFSVGNAARKYILSVSSYSGNEHRGDTLSYHTNMRFSTFDQDNDVDKTQNCANSSRGAWWYKGGKTADGCFRSNLNGVYGSHNYAGFEWVVPTTDQKYFTEMKLRQL